MDNLQAVNICELNDGDITEAETIRLSQILSGQPIGKGPYCRIGWLDAVLAWVQDNAGPFGFEFNGNVRQYSAKGSFGLARFGSKDGSALWLKATSETHRHELAITDAISRCCGQFTPNLIAMKQDWNAWLSREAGEPLSDQSGYEILERATHSLAGMQRASRPYIDDLRKAGCSDLSLNALHSCLPALKEYLDSSMAQQRSRRVAPLLPGQIAEMHYLITDAIVALEKLEIEDVLLHNDLNCGNVLINGNQVFFIDWAEAGIGHPLFGLHHLLALAEGRNQLGDTTQRLHDVYVEHWRKRLSAENIRKAYVLSGPLATLCYLCGRDPSFTSSYRHIESVQSYARSLARHVNRMVHASEFREVL